MKLLISGFYGFGNAGDDWLMLSQLERFSNYGFNKFTVAGGPLRFQSKKYSIKWVDRDNLELIKEEIKDSDLFALGGGGLFQEHHGLNPLGVFDRLKCSNMGYLQLPLLAKLCGKKVAYLDQGIGPVFTEEGAKAIEYAYALADFISVRDQSSLDILKALGIRHAVLGCDAFVSDIEKLRKSKSHVIKIGIACRYWEKDSELKLSHVLKSLKNEKLDSFEFTYLSFFNNKNKNSDYQFLKKVKRVDPKGEIIDLSQTSMKETDSVFHSLDLLITSRYHGILLALNYLTPVIPIMVDLKLYSLVKENKLENLSLWPKQLTGEAVIKIINLITSQPDVINSQLKQAKNNLLRQKGNAIEAEVKFVKKILEKPRISRLETILEIPSIKEYDSNQSPLFNANEKEVSHVLKRKAARRIMSAKNAKIGKSSFSSRVVLFLKLFLATQRGDFK